jgi:hypothetical protein
MTEREEICARGCVLDEDECEMLTLGLTAAAARRYKNKHNTLRCGSAQH